MIKYSFIIPVKEINDNIRQAIPRILEIRRDDFEILVYPDETSTDTWPKTRQIASGPGGPAMKRNLSIRDAQGEILIFIDDDAYPGKYFLEILDRNYSEENITAVGGPSLTPNESKFWQRVSGAMFLSSLSGGFPERYRSTGKKRFVDDWPTVNLSIKKKIFEDVSGFSCEFWPGEDTKLCHDLLTKKNIRILYDPDLIVYHHRREGLLKHVEQISAYGLHRGYFVKKYPRTSLRWLYFVPSVFVIFIFGGAVASFYSGLALKIYFLGWGIYFLALLKALFDIYRHEKNLLVSVTALYYILLTHIFYGIKFLQGLIFVKDLKSRLR
jgi:glycosyltransferase involved in cell wall biosynthesis